MSVWVDCYAEAKVNGVWKSVDFFSKRGNEFVIAPIMEGQSMFYSAITWEAANERVSYSDLSEELRGMWPDNEYVSWYKIPGSWFEIRDLEQPEFCGYIPRQQVADFKAGEIDEINDEELICASEFAAMTPDAQRGYDYIEYTNPFSVRDYMRRLKRGMEDRMVQYNEYGRRSTEDRRDPAITLSDMRMIVRVC